MSQRWTHEQFDEMSWHDNYVHALRIVEAPHGAGQLILDIDYILEWLQGPDGMRFRIAPSTLRFIDVINLRISLDYATPGAGLCPFAIHAIERRAEQRTRYVAYLWRIVVSWPRGDIAFEAAGFEQQTVRDPIVSDRQGLKPDQRGI